MEATKQNSSYNKQSQQQPRPALDNQKLPLQRQNSSLSDVSSVTRASQTAQTAATHATQVLIPVIQSLEETVLTQASQLNNQKQTLEATREIAYHNLKLGINDRQNAGHFATEANTHLVAANYFADQTILQGQEIVRKEQVIQNKDWKIKTKDKVIKFKDDVINAQGQEIEEIKKFTKNQKKKLRKKNNAIKQKEEEIRQKEEAKREAEEKLKQEATQKNALKNIVKKQSQSNTKKTKTINSLEQSQNDLKKNAVSVNQKTREATEKVKVAEQKVKEAEAEKEKAEKEKAEKQAEAEKAKQDKATAEQEAKREILKAKVAQKKAKEAEEKATKIIEEQALLAAIEKSTIEKQNISLGDTHNDKKNETDLKQLKLNAGIPIDYLISYEIDDKKEVTYKIQSQNLNMNQRLSLDFCFTDKVKIILMQDLTEDQLGNNINPNTPEAKAEREEIVYNLAKFHTQLRIKKDIINELSVPVTMFQGKKPYIFKDTHENVVDESFEKKLAAKIKVFFKDSGKRNFSQFEREHINKTVKTVLIPKFLQGRKKVEDRINNQRKENGQEPNFAYIKTEYQQKFE